MKWWQKKVKGWTVPFWYTDTPLFSYRFSKLNKKELKQILKQVRRNKF
jgi:hypothetical protein